MFGVRGYPTIWFVTPEIKIMETYKCNKCGIMSVNATCGKCNTPLVKESKVNFAKLGYQGYVAGGPPAWLAGANKIIKPKK